MKLKELLSCVRPSVNDGHRASPRRGESSVGSAASIPKKSMGKKIGAALRRLMCVRRSNVREDIESGVAEPVTAESVRSTHSPNPLATIGSTVPVETADTTSEITLAEEITTNTPVSPAQDTTKNQLNAIITTASALQVDKKDVPQFVHAFFAAAQQAVKTQKYPIAVAIQDDSENATDKKYSQILSDALREIVNNKDNIIALLPEKAQPAPNFSDGKLFGGDITTHDAFKQLTGKSSLSPRDVLHDVALERYTQNPAKFYAPFLQQQYVQKMVALLGVKPENIEIPRMHSIVDSLMNTVAPQLASAINRSFIDDDKVNILNIAFDEMNDPNIKFNSQKFSVNMQEFLNGVISKYLNPKNDTQSIIETTPFDLDNISEFEAQLPAGNTPAIKLRLHVDEHAEHLRVDILPIERVKKQTAVAGYFKNHDSNKQHFVAKKLLEFLQENPTHPLSAYKEALSATAAAQHQSWQQQLVNKFMAAGTAQALSITEEFATDVFNGIQEKFTEPLLAQATEEAIAEIPTVAQDSTSILQQSRVSLADALQRYHQR